MQKRTRTLCCTHKILPWQNEQDVVLVVHVHRSEDIIVPRCVHRLAPKRNPVRFTEHIRMDGEPRTR